MACADGALLDGNLLDSFKRLGQRVLNEVLEVVDRGLMEFAVGTRDRDLAADFFGVAPAMNCEVKDQVELVIRVRAGAMMGGSAVLNLVLHVAGIACLRCPR